MNEMETAKGRAMGQDGGQRYPVQGDGRSGGPPPGWQQGQGGGQYQQPPGQPRYLPPWQPQGQQPYQAPPPAGRPPSRHAAPPRPPGRRKSPWNRPGVIAIVALPVLVVTWLIVAGAGKSAPPAAGPSTPAPAASESVIAPGAPKALAPLALGHFPATAGGELARGICVQWRGLRPEYADMLTADTPYQMNQWFSSSAWAKEMNDASQLGGDPAYSNLETALGVATAGDYASTANAAAVDKACEKAD